MLWLAACCAFNYVAIRFDRRASGNEAYHVYPDPSWLAPCGITCAVIGGALLAWALAWPLRASEDHSPVSEPHEWVVFLVVLGSLDSIAVATAVTAPDSSIAWQPLVMASVLTLMMVFGRSLWDPTRSTTADRSAPS